MINDVFTHAYSLARLFDVVLRAHLENKFQSFSK